MSNSGRQPIASFVRFVLEATWWAVAVGTAMLVVLLAISFFVEIPGEKWTLELPVAVRLDAPLYGPDGKTDAQIEKLRGNLRFPARQGVFFSGSVALAGLMCGYLLWTVTQLRHVFRSLSRRLIFASDNARRIRSVGFAVIFGEIGRAIVVYLWSWYTSQHFTISGLRFAASADFNPTAIVGGLAILVIAEVFQEGARLQDEQSLTI